GPSGGRRARNYRSELGTQLLLRALYLQPLLFAVISTAMVARRRVRPKSGAAMALRHQSGGSPILAAWLACLLLVATACISIAWAAEEKAARQAQPEGPGNVLVRLEIRDAIGPATSGFLLRGLERARERNAQLVVIE